MPESYRVKVELKIWLKQNRCMFSNVIALFTRPTNTDKSEERIISQAFVKEEISDMGLIVEAKLMM